MGNLPSPNRQTTIARGMAQLPKLVSLMCLVYIPIFLGLSGLIATYFIADIPLRWFFIDPVAEFNAPMYIGLVSNFGVLLWGAAASTCLFGGWLAYV